MTVHNPRGKSNRPASQKRAVPATQGADFAFIGEFRASRSHIRTIANYAEGSIVENIVYPLDGTPCAKVLETEEVCAYERGVAALFPEDVGLVDHDDLLFRASRAHANTTESVGAVILIAFFAIATGASPGVSNSLLAGFVACRVVHMVAYYSDLRVLRSVAFGLGVLALLGLLGAGVAARFG